MPIKGCYSLTVTCDNNPCQEHTVVSAASCSSAVQDARGKGWRITADRAYCPKCSGSGKARRE